MSRWKRARAWLRTRVRPPRRRPDRVATSDGCTTSRESTAMASRRRALPQRLAVALQRSAAPSRPARADRGPGPGGMRPANSSPPPAPPPRLASIHDTKSLGWKGRPADQERSTVGTWRFDEWTTSASWSMTRRAEERAGHHARHPSHHVLRRRHRRRHCPPAHPSRRAAYRRGGRRRGRVGRGGCREASLRWTSRSCSRVVTRTGRSR